MKDAITMADKYEPTIKITEQAEADAYFERCVEHTLRIAVPPVTRQLAEAIERENIGFFAGYYSHEDRARVERLFHCAHPFFGAIAEKGPPTPEEAFRMGVELGKALRERR